MLRPIQATFYIIAINEMFRTYEIFLIMLVFYKYYFFFNLKLDTLISNTFNKCGTNIYFFTLQRFGPSPSLNFKTLLLFIQDIKKSCIKKVFEATVLHTD